MPAIKSWRGQRRRASSTNSFLINMCRSRDRNTFITVIVLACIIITILFSYAAFGQTITAAVKDSSLVTAFIVFRHGERAPNTFYPKDPYQDLKHWPEGIGQLTNKGKMDLYEVGKMLRSHYNSFLPKTYSNEDFEMRSSYADRCQMSALTLLAGLYPPTSAQVWNKELLWQPIPINSVPRDQDNVIVIGKPCPNYTRLRSQVQADLLKNFTSDQRELLEYLTVNSGLNITTLADVESLYFTLLVEADNNLKLPEWTKQVFPKKMLPLAQLMQASLSWNKKMKRFAAGEMLREWRERMTAASNEGYGHVKKMYLYSGHDVTLMNVMRGLGFDTMELTDYGSSLHIQLWHSIQNGYHVQVLLYKSGRSASAESLAVPGCDVACPVHRFFDLIDPIVTDNWTEECNE